MKIYVVGSSKNRFLSLDRIREKFLVDIKHTGKNIDFLNPWYCELTGLYYLWKNTSDEIVGLEHYRNYFWKNGHPINEKEIIEQLKTCDIICGGFKYPCWGCRTLRPELTKHSNCMLPRLCEAIEKYDPKLLKAFNEYLDGQVLWCCNTFITTRKIMNEWCEFIFNLLPSFENTDDFDNTNLRRDGYLTEFLFGAWLTYKGYKISHCDMNKLSRDLRKTEFMVLGPDKQIKFR